MTDRILAQFVESDNNHSTCIDCIDVFSLMQKQVFIILGIAVNCGANTDHRYIGNKYFYTGEAPFVDGIGGFASVFVTASFA